MVWAHRMVLSGPAKTGSDHQEGPPRQPRGCQVRPTCHSRPQPGRAGSLQAAATHPQTGCAVCPGRPPSVLTASLALRPLAASRRRGTPGEAATSLRRMIPQTWPRPSATWLTAEGAGHPGFPWRCQAPKQNTLGWALWVRSPTMPAEGLGSPPQWGLQPHSTGPHTHARHQVAQPALRWSLGHIKELGVLLARSGWIEGRCPTPLGGQVGPRGRPSPRHPPGWWSGHPVPWAMPHGGKWRAPLTSSDFLCCSCPVVAS